MKNIARKCGLLILLPAWTLWVHAAGAVPKVLCFDSEDQVRLETSVNGSCQTESPETTPETAAECQSTCGDCADLALELDVVKHRLDIPQPAEIDGGPGVDPPHMVAATNPGRDELLRSRQFLRQRTPHHHSLLSQPGTLPLIC